MDSYTNVINFFLSNTICSNWQVPGIYTSASTILSNVLAGWGILGAAPHIGFGAVGVVGYERQTLNRNSEECFLSVKGQNS